MSKWFCELSESYHDTSEEAKETCCEFINDDDYIEHLYYIESCRLFKALTDPQLAEEIFYEIIEATENEFFENYVTEIEEDEEDEEDDDY